jgi:hypothetical protein
MLQCVHTPFDHTDSLNGGSYSLKDILARVPGLQEIYRRTFFEDAACLPVSVFYRDKIAQLRIDDTHLFQDRDDLRLRVGRWRHRYPWLKNWCLIEATHAWGNSILTFYNLEKPTLDEFSDQRLIGANNGFGASYQGRQLVPFETIVPPLAGGVTKTHQTSIQPLNGTSLSEFSLQFCGAFLLSSLVRYRP